MAPQWNHSLQKLYILGNLKKKLRHRISESISGEENSAPVVPSGWTPVLGPGIAAIAAIASWVKLLALSVMCRICDALITDLINVNEMNAAFSGPKDVSNGLQLNALRNSPVSKILCQQKLPWSRRHPQNWRFFHFHLGDSTALSLAMEQGGSQELKLDMNPTVWAWRTSSG